MDGSIAGNALLFTPLGRDSAIAAAMLGEAGIGSTVVRSLPAFAAALSDGAGFALVAEEALRDADLRAVRGFLDSQPEWSDFPFILLTEHGGSVERNPGAARLLEALGNVTFLERPFHPTTLISLSRAALRARRRQYDARSRLQEIRLAEERLRIALSAGALGAWSIDLPGQTLETSAECRAHYGLAAQSPFTYEDLLAAIHPDDRAAMQQSVVRSLRTGEDYEVEYRCQWPDASLHWIQVRGRVDRGPDGRVNRMAGVTLDITERRRAEAALIESEARFRAAIDAVQGVLWTNNPAGEMIGEQPGWSALTGQSFDEYQGYGWADAIHPDDAQPTILAWNAAVAARRKFEFEHRVRRHDGQWRDFAIRAIPAIEADGSIREWIGVHTDITEQRTAERQLAAIASNLEERVRTATAELKNSQETLLQSQKLETIGQLTGGIAHDFNNLLTPIVGSLDFLRRRLENDERAQRLAAAGLQSADRAKTLVNRLLAFARRQTLDYQAVDIAELIEGMRDLIDRAIGPMIALHVDLPGDLPATLIDANQLELSILNLCVNARDAMAEGGSIWISAVAERVTALHPAGMAPGDYVRISVSDNGAGMDAETARRAIEPFYTTKEIGKGTGLGLSMVHGLTAQLGGGMTIDSRPGEGSRISLWLPAVFDSLPRPIAAAAPVSVAPSRSATVLLVDDEVLVRLATGEMLREAGYTVIEAGSGAEAREAVRAGLTPDILVSDQLMPGMKGNELATELREVFPSLRVLLATGYADLPDLKFPRIAKPYGAVELVERVRALVEDVRANP